MVGGIGDGVKVDVGDGVSVKVPVGITAIVFVESAIGVATSG